MIAVQFDGHIRIDRTMTTRQAAALFNRAIVTIQRWCRAGLLRAIKVGRKWRIAVSKAAHETVKDALIANGVAAAGWAIDEQRAMDRADVVAVASQFGGITGGLKGLVWVNVDGVYVIIDMRRMQNAVIAIDYQSVDAVTAAVQAILNKRSATIEMLRQMNADMEQREIEDGEGYGR